MSDELDPPELGAEVIPIRPRKAPPDQGLTVVRNYAGRSCHHDNVDLDYEKRTAECRSCRAPLDAFDTLVKFGQKWDRFRSDHERCRNEIKGYESRIELLKRQENNARSRAKRLFDDVPSKQQMHEMLDGRIWMWVYGARVELRFDQRAKSLTPQQARDVARQLLKYAREAEKPFTIDKETGEEIR